VRLFLKTHVKGHYRSVGGRRVYVRPYDDERQRRFSDGGTTGPSLLDLMEPSVMPKPVEEPRQRARTLRERASALTAEAAEYNRATGGRAVKNKGRNNIHEMGGAAVTFRAPSLENSESAHHRALLTEAARLREEAKKIESTIPKRPRRASQPRVRVKRVKWDWMHQAIADIPGDGHRVVADATNLPSDVLRRLGWRRVFLLPGKPPRVFAESRDGSVQSVQEGGRDRDVIAEINGRVQAVSSQEEPPVVKDYLERQRRAALTGGDGHVFRAGRYEVGDRVVIRLRGDRVGGTVVDAHDREEMGKGLVRRLKVRLDHTVAYAKQITTMLPLTGWYDPQREGRVYRYASLSLHNPEDPVVWAGLPTTPVPGRLRPSDAMGKAHATGYPLQGRTKFQGLDISIEQRKGGVRHWEDPETGETGTTKMKWPYGYIRGTEGVDGDHVDCYLGPDEGAPMVYIVTQVRPDTGKVDEQKVMLGFSSAEEAKRAYLAHIPARWFGSMTKMPMEEFKAKVMRTLHGRKMVKSA